MTLQDQLLDFLNKKYGVRKVKKINQDNYLDLYFPEINEDEKTHLFFNTARNKIKFGFFCKDNKWMNNQIKNHSDKIEICPQGLRLIDNPEFSSIEDFKTEILDFIEILINGNKEIILNTNNSLEKIEKIQISSIKTSDKNSSIDISKVTLEDGSVYEGQIDNGIPNGKGKIKFTNGNIYEGIVCNGFASGRGIMMYHENDIFEGDVYEGEWKDGKRSGHGILRSLDGYVYEGKWENNHQQGKGKFTNPEGDVYEGDFNGEDGEFSYGKMTYANGDVYLGEWSDNIKHGQGKMVYANGDEYVGEWIEDERIGKSKFEKENKSEVKVKNSNELSNNEVSKIILEDGSEYEGALKNGIPHGLGKIIYPNGNVYEGKIIDGDLVKGKMIFEDGTSYEGDWIFDEPMGKGEILFANGDVYEGGVYGYADDDVKGRIIILDDHGVMKYANGDIYDGNWFFGFRHKKGKMKYANGDEYDEEWNLDQRVGKTKFEIKEEKDAELKKKNEENTIQTISYTDGSKYIGYLKDNKWTKGKYIWADGSFYDGDFKDNKSNGKGKQAYTNGDVYEGEWKDDMKHGIGKMSYVNGNVYVGDWKNSQRFGKGKITYSSGASYDGDWADNKRNGRGKYLWANGDVYEGDFYNDEMHGQAKVKFINGDFYQGEFKFGQRVSKTKFEIEADKKKPKPFTIQYTIKLKEDKGYFIKTEKGSFIRKTLKVQHIGELNEGKAKQYIITNDRDIQNGKAGTSTIIIEKITPNQL